MTAPPTETFEFRTCLAAGRELDYERFHRAIPADLDRAMRDAGVVGWRIYRDRTNLTHVVEACDRERMQATLEADPVNRAWQKQVAPFLAPSSRSAGLASPATARGTLIWDMSWPTR
jgi:L-rhamnose mutarotase